MIAQHACLSLSADSALCLLTGGKKTKEISKRLLQLQQANHSDVPPGKYKLPTDAVVLFNCKGGSAGDSPL